MWAVSEIWVTCKSVSHTRFIPLLFLFILC
jgi:hypothetical protein